MRFEYFSANAENARYSPPCNPFLSKDTMMELENFEKQSYADAALVVADAARFAFLQTLHSPSQPSPKTSFKESRKTIECKSKLSPKSQASPSPKPLPMRKSSSKGRQLDVSLEKEPTESQHKKRKSRLPFSTLRSLFSCFLPPEEKPSRKRQKYGHCSTTSSIWSWSVGR